MRQLHLGKCLGWLAAPAVLIMGGGAQSDPLPDVNEMRESVVYIEVEFEQGGGSGTGFILNNRGMIATNFHVAGKAKSIAVSFMGAGGKPMTTPAHLVDGNEQQDIAIIQADNNLFGDPVVLGNYDVSPPMKVEAVGYPGAANLSTNSQVDDVVSVTLNPSYSAGTVGRILKDVTSMGGDTLIQTTAVINHGNSGGPLFDECGRVIGINSMGVDPTEGSGYAQGLFWAIDVRALLPMLEANLVEAHIATKPCAPGIDARNDIPPASTKEAEAVAFDRFTACVNTRPCDAEICKARYARRVSTALVGSRQSDIDVRMSAAAPACTIQKEAEAYRTFARCADSDPCKFDETCAPQLQKSLRPEIMIKRQTLVDRASGQAAEQCKQASAPGVWRVTSEDAPVYQARIYNKGQAFLQITCALKGDDAGSGAIALYGVKGNPERWEGTRNIRMTVESYSEPLSVDLQTDGENLTAERIYAEGENQPGAFKDFLGKLAVGGVVSFESSRVGLDETFSLDHSLQALSPCLNVNKVAQHQADDTDQQSDTAQQ
jgi:trypsin-like peptidase